MPHPKMITGGQTGVDRAVLDACLDRGWPCGGWCPAGRIAEDGRIDDRYPLCEAASPAYAVRTGANLQEADATVVVVAGVAVGGTLLSLELLRDLGKPHLVVDLADEPAAAAVAIVAFIREGGFGIVNWSGPRASEAPGGYVWVRTVMDDVMRLLRVKASPNGAE